MATYFQLGGGLGLCLLVAMWFFYGGVRRSNTAPSKPRVVDVNSDFTSADVQRESLGPSVDRAQVRRAWSTLETLAPRALVVAAFDFDGTITTSDSLPAFVRNTVGSVRLIFGTIRAAPWLVGMLIGTCDRASAKSHFLAVTLGGMTRQALEASVQRFVANDLLKLIRPEMAVRIQEHRRRGDRLVLISASPALYLKMWARSVGFEAVLATELEFRDDCFSGRLASPNCWGPEKVRRLRQWFGSDPLPMLYMYGDSRGDREILALADYGWLRGHGRMPTLDAWRRQPPA